MGNRSRSRTAQSGLRLRGWIPGSGTRWRARPLATIDEDTGATTAEFAIVTMAAVGFAGLLVVILRSDGVRATLEALVSRALNTGG